MVAIRCRTGICRISAVVADVLGTQGKEDTRSLLAQQAGIVCLEMVGAYIVGWRTGNMVSGVGLHRIHFQHVLFGRSPENVHLGSLVRIVIDEAWAITGIGTQVVVGSALHVALYVAQDAQLVLLAQYAHDALSAAIGVAEETYSSAHSVLTLAQGDVNHLFQTAASLHHLRVLANLDALYLPRLEMMEQGSVVETIFLVVDADDELAVEIGERITADDVVAVHRKDFGAHHQHIEERFLAREFHF